MDWYQVLTIIFSVFGLFLWLHNRIEKVEDKMMVQTREIIKEIRDSNLDFHGRLSKLEGKLGDK